MTAVRDVVEWLSTAGARVTGDDRIAIRGQGFTPGELVNYLSLRLVDSDGRYLRPCDIKRGFAAYARLTGQPNGPQEAMDRFLREYTQPGGECTLLDFYAALREHCAVRGWPLRGWTNLRCSASLRRRGYRLKRTRIGQVILGLALTDNQDEITARRFAKSRKR